MERHPNDRTTEADIDAAFERAKMWDTFPTIVEASYHPEPGMEFLLMKLSDGRRLLVPKEHLGELNNATAEQALDLRIGRHGVDIWWPQLDDGLYLPEFLKHRWAKQFEELAA